MIKEKTTQDLMNDWLSALRSGEYEQIEGFLYTEEGKCCLGVLGCIASVPFEKGYEEPDVFVVTDEEGQDNIAILPYMYARPFGLDKRVTSSEGAALYEYTGEAIPGESRQQRLAYMNDNGYTFEQVADVIEAMGWNKVDDKW